MHFNSWGNFPTPKNQKAIVLKSVIDNHIFDYRDISYLPRGLGRSYGDSCLNDSGTLLLTSNLDHFISFNKTEGILIAQSGTTFDSILQLTASHGWLLPVLPGTKFITLGGAIANDIHGKNHHQAGSFGNYVLRFELLRSSGERFICSKTENASLFYATIGGLGLTGLITWAEVKLKPIQSSLVRQKQIQFSSFDEYKKLAEENKSYPYTVAWIDCLSKNLRGIFMAGDHVDRAEVPINLEVESNTNVPFFLPSALLNKYTVTMFNAFYHRKNFSNIKEQITSFNQFFFPLDSIYNWNRIYGRRGFLQYQFVVPPDPNNDLLIKAIFKKIYESGLGSFLAVLKTFGDIPSVGYLSFPTKGITLALDFPNSGSELFQLLSACDELLLECKGRIYPAKDARMNRRMFHNASYNLNLFIKEIDPLFSSSFWRRVK